MNFDEMFGFSLKTRIVYGYNCTDKLSGEIEKLGKDSVLVVTDEGVLQGGVVDPVFRNLKEAGLHYEVFSDVPVDPGTQVVENGVDFIKKTNCNIIVVVGGGSALCAGKGIALVAANGGNLREYEGAEKFRHPPLPLIALPTTAGSGSEVSPKIIISDENRNGYKMTVSGEKIYPVTAFLDPFLLRSLPSQPFITAGVDALVHAVEATWTNQATPLTDAIAYEAIRLMIENLPKAAFSNDLEAKSKQLIASTMANIACGNANLGLVHAMTQPVESYYHLAHGLVCGILLPYVMEYNLPAAEDKLARISFVLGEDRDGPSQPQQARRAVDIIKEFLQSVQIPAQLPENLISQEDIPELAKTAMGRIHVKLNMRKASENDIIEIYKKVIPN